MAKKMSFSKYVMCVKNDDYPTSLEVRKVYRAIADKQAADIGFIRVEDESGEDYLYPRDLFVAIELPKAAAGVFAEAS